MDGRKNNGGARNGAGRKKIAKAEKKEPVTVFFKKKTISANGGVKTFKRLILANYED